MHARALSTLYHRAHDRMRDVDGLQPQEALDELLKFLSLKEFLERSDCGHRRNAMYGYGPDTLRQRFSSHVRHLTPWAARFWKDGQLRLSDVTLSDLQRLFAPIHLRDLPLDVRGAALRSFLAPNIRKGLGIFLTPDDVARAMVEIAAPATGETILDPACGSGTFLLEAARFIKRQSAPSMPTTIYGIEKNPRMLLLADLNLAHSDDLDFRRECADALRDLHTGASPLLGLSPESVDLILTNPPFGVTVTRDATTSDLFGSGQILEDHLPSEIFFLQLCLRLLRPGGRLGIILPRSVITNERLAKQRREMDALGHLTTLVDLPPETFAVTGTQTTTVAAFFRKRDVGTPRTTTVKVCLVKNVGVDGTGRKRPGNQLPNLSKLLTDESPKKAAPIKIHNDVSTENTLQRAAKLLSRRASHNYHRSLEQFIGVANTGRTPERNAYTKSGTFIVKVGNLTGRGIDWTPRERNFVSKAEGDRRSASDRLSLQRGDLLLTSSAHSAKYIAKKVDVIEDVPNEIERHGGLTFVGEIIRIRPSHDIDPYVLLAAIRHPDVREDLQASVRGQTAHLNPADLLTVNVPWDLRSPSHEVLEIADLLRREAKMAFQLNSVSSAIALRFRQRAPR